MIANIKSKNTRVSYSQIANAREANDGKFKGTKNDALKLIAGI